MRPASPGTSKGNAARCSNTVGDPAASPATEPGEVAGGGGGGARTTSGIVIVIVFCRRASMMNDCGTMLLFAGCHCSTTAHSMQASSCLLEQVAQAEKTGWCTNCSASSPWCEAVGLTLVLASLLRRPWDVLSYSSHLHNSTKIPHTMQSTGACCCLVLWQMQAGPTHQLPSHPTARATVRGQVRGVCGIRQEATSTCSTQAAGVLSSPGRQLWSMKTGQAGSSLNLHHHHPPSQQQR
jgi:hypothetical protein